MSRCNTMNLKGLTSECTNVLVVSDWSDILGSEKDENETLNESWMKIQKDQKNLVKMQH